MAPGEIEVMDYEKCRSLIHSRCWHFANCNPGVNVSDLESLGNELYMKATEGFNPDNGTQFITYLTTILNNSFAEYLNTRDLQIEAFVGDIPDIPSLVTRVTPARMAEVKDDLMAMGSDAKAIVGIFLEAPAEVLKIGMADTPKEIRGALFNFLHDVEGWGINRIYDAIREVKETVRRM